MTRDQAAVVLFDAAILLRNAGVDWGRYPENQRPFAELRAWLMAKRKCTPHSAAVLYLTLLGKVLYEPPAATAPLLPALSRNDQEEEWPKWRWLGTACFLNGKPARLTHSPSGLCSVRPDDRALDLQCNWRTAELVMTRADGRFGNRGHTPYEIDPDVGAPKENHGTTSGHPKA